MKKMKNPSNVFAGRNLKYFMECNDISEKQLADSLCLERDSLVRILNGTNAISAPYNSILLKDYNCDLNFIYGGIEKSDMLHCNVDKIMNLHMKSERQNLREAIIREMRYLLDILELIDKMEET